MIKLHTDEKDFIPYTISKNKVIVRINSENKNGIIFYDEFRIPLVSKDVLISSLINANYPADKMDAVRNNYELVKDGTAGDKAEEYTQEYLTMQNWRAYSKELATEIMNSKENVT
jgi:hypothetical protein